MATPNSEFSGNDVLCDAIVVKPQESLRVLFSSPKVMVTLYVVEGCKGWDKCQMYLSPSIIEPSDVLSAIGTSGVRRNSAIGGALVHDTIIVVPSETSVALGAGEIGVTS